MSYPLASLLCSWSLGWPGRRGHWGLGGGKMRLCLFQPGSKLRPGGSGLLSGVYLQQQLCLGSGQWENSLESRSLGVFLSDSYKCLIPFLWVYFFESVMKAHTLYWLIFMFLLMYRFFLPFCSSPWNVFVEETSLFGPVEFPAVWVWLIISLRYYVPRSSVQWSLCKLVIALRGLIQCSFLQDSSDNPSTANRSHIISACFSWWFISY